MTDGTTQKKTISMVLLHGWGLNQMIWRADSSLFRALSNQYDVTLLDLPGYGNDGRYDGGYDLEQIGKRVLDQSPPRAVWVAWSLGATVALQCALTAPNRIAGLALIAPTPRFMAGANWDFGMSPEPFDLLKQEFENNYRRGLKRFLLLQSSDRILIRNIIENTLKMPEPRSEIILKSLELLKTTDLRAVLPRLAPPVEIIVGRNDTIVSPRASQNLYAFLPSNAQSKTIVEFEGGHLCFLEQPNQFLKILHEFVGAIRV
jgi:pimeloyl-[acyl-carrier protein] methyl ester esterase